MRVKVFYYLHGYLKHTKIKENSHVQFTKFTVCILLEHINNISLLPYKAKTTTGNGKKIKMS